MDISLVAVDLDGTLLNSSKKISSKTFEALKQLSKQGIKIVPLSGRPLPGVLKVMRAFNLDPQQNYAICYNGGLIQRLDGQVIDQNPLSQVQIRNLAQISEPGIFGPYFMDLENFYYLENRTAIGLSQLAKRRDMGVQKLRLGTTITAIKAEFVGLPFALRKLSSKLSGDLQVTSSSKFNLELNSSLATKGRAITTLADELGISLNKVMIFGDNTNDLSAFNLPEPYKVAMGNAIDEIKQRANFVTTSNNQDGIATALEKLILN